MLLSLVHGTEHSDFGILEPIHPSKGYIRRLKGYTQSTMSTTPLSSLWRVGCSTYMTFARWTCLLSRGRAVWSTWLARWRVCLMVKVRYSIHFFLSSFSPFYYNVAVGVRVLFCSLFVEDCISPHSRAAELKLSMCTRSRFCPSCLHISINPLPFLYHFWGLFCPMVPWCFFSLSLILLSPPCFRLFLKLTHILQDTQPPPSKAASPSNISTLPPPPKKKNMHSNATAKPSTKLTTSGPSIPSPSIPPSTPSPLQVPTGPCRSGTIRSKRGWDSTPSSPGRWPLLRLIAMGRRLRLGLVIRGMRVRKGWRLMLLRRGWV